MEIIRKAIASIAPGANDADTPHGSFTVILSTPALDRDGEQLKSSEWAKPLPDHITFDVDHGMSVATTVGSGHPTIDAKGRLVVDGTYASTQLGQDTRALVNEGHIVHTSVAFIRRNRTDQKGVKQIERVLINGAFVAIPANTEAMVLGSKVGARNSANDAKSIQTIHDTATGLGANCSTGKTFGRKDAGDDPATLAAAVDASLDQAVALLDGVDLTLLPDEVQQALALVQAAEAASDDLMDALGLYDPLDDPAGTDTAAPAAAKAAADAAQVEAIRVRIHTLATKGTPP